MSHPRFAHGSVLLSMAVSLGEIMPRLILAVFAAVSLTLVPTNQARAGETALVPAYFYPGTDPSDWTRLDAGRPNDPPGRHRQSG